MINLGTLQIAVVGAHLSGQPLNYQLTERRAVLSKTCRTAPDYFLYALAGTVPLKPALKRVAPGKGYAIEVEVWEMPLPEFGSFMQLIKSPLGIGTLILEDNSAVHGFICEPWALEAAADISAFGGWRNYLASLP